MLNFNQNLEPDYQKAESETFQQWMKRLFQHSGQQDCFEQANQIFQNIVYLPTKNQQDIQKFKFLLKECADALKQRK